VLTLLWYLLLLILGWIALWLFVYFFSSTVLCPKCGGEMEWKFSFLRGQGKYCRRCWHED
jgi:hypothetical protein